MANEVKDGGSPAASSNQPRNPNHVESGNVVIDRYQASGQIDITLKDGKGGIEAIVTDVPNVNMLGATQNNKQGNPESKFINDPDLAQRIAQAAEGALKSGVSADIDKVGTIAVNFAQGMKDKQVQR